MPADAEECVLTNVPRIGDVEVMARLLLDVGAEVEGIGTTTLRIRTPSVTTHAPIVPWSDGSAARCCCSGRCWRAPAARISRRPAETFRLAARISTHLEALFAMGARDDGGPDHALEAPDGLRGASMYLEEASVTGTETALLAAASTAGTTEIRHAATEPHVVELCEFLVKMGAGITGIGSSRLRIEGTARLKGAQHQLGGDYIEAGSWAVVGAITGGEMAIEGARDEDIEVIAAVMKRMNVECGMRDGVFHVKPSKPKAVRRITTGLWPAFPSDLVSLVTVLATQSEGRTLVHDWMYELRLFALEQMSGMGADLFLADAHRIIVTGPTKLRGGRTLDSRDLRSGMSLIAAGLAAEGQTRVAPLETVERGYSNVVQRLVSLGAKVAKVE